MRSENIARTGKKVRALSLLGIAAATLAAGACGSDTTSPELARVKVQITDAPSDMFDMAEVWISRVYLQGSDADSTSDGGRVDLFNDPDNPRHYDLLTLRDSVTADVSNAVDVDPGLYEGLRLVVDSARLTLVEGIVFEDSTSTGVLFVPSGSQSGIKVKLNAPVDASPDTTVTVVVDFDVDANFVVQQNQDGTIRKILFTPVLTERKRSSS